MYLAIRKLLAIGLVALLVMPQSAASATDVEVTTVAAVNLTATEMANAITVADARFETRAGLPHNAVFRFQSCDPNKPEAPCYFKVTTGSDPQARQIDFSALSREQIILASTNSTLVCGLPFYNGFITA